ncbi:MAG: hypothetical protein QM796_16575 [Chthoniobacteraceae bacterium]
MKLHPLILTLVLALPLQWYCRAAAPKSVNELQTIAAANRMLGGIEQLPEADQQKLRAARDKALFTPGLQAALVDQRDTNKDFQQVLQTALLTADPKIEPILAKVNRTGRGLLQMNVQLLRNGGGKGPLGDLSDSERQEVVNAFMQSRQQPQVEDARQRMITANQTVIKTLHAEMVKADPTLAPLVQQLGGGQSRQPGARLRKQRNFAPDGAAEMPSPTPSPSPMELGTGA